MSDTRLSIIMPSYNHGSFLRQRIPSILSQLSDHDELIVVDDASQDESKVIIQQLVSKDSRIRLIINDSNQGAVRSANIATKAAKGIYLCWLAADDLLLDGFIEKTMSILLNNSDIGLCCSDCARWFDGFQDKPADQIYTDILLENVSEPLIIPAKSALNLFSNTHFWVPGHTSIMKRKLVLQYGGFQELLGPYCDWFLLHRIALESGVGYIPEKLSVWRQDIQSYSKQATANPKHKKAFQMAILELLAKRESKKFRPLFKKSGVLHAHIKDNLMTVCFRPNFWDYLYHFVKRFLIFRLRKLKLKESFSLKKLVS